MELYHRPATEFVAGFIGAPSMNFLDVRGEGGRLVHAGTPIGRLSPVPGAVRLGIRPEHVVLAAPGAGDLDARVDLREALGGDSYLYVSLPSGERLVVRAEGDTEIGSGAVVGISFPAARVHLFAADGRTLQSGAVTA
jgi:ABC-type sugar transport system ATPase subunit